MSEWMKKFDSDRWTVRLLFLPALILILYLSAYTGLSFVGQYQAFIPLPPTPDQAAGMSPTIAVRWTPLGFATSDHHWRTPLITLFAPLLYLDRTYVHKKA